MPAGPGSYVYHDANSNYQTTRKPINGPGSNDESAASILQSVKEQVSVCEDQYQGQRS